MNVLRTLSVAVCVCIGAIAAVRSYRAPNRCAEPNEDAEPIVLSDGPELPAGYELD